MDDQLFVVRYSSQQRIAVYDTATFSSLRKIFQFLVSASHMADWRRVQSTTVCMFLAIIRAVFTELNYQVPMVSENGK
jgi:hypothetical protein